MTAADKMAKALRRLLRSQPTDSDMVQAAWEPCEVNEAREAIESAREALAAYEAEQAAARQLVNISSIDVERMISQCLPGGSICDPQQVADAIRAYCNARPEQAAAPKAEAVAGSHLYGYAYELWVDGQMSGLSSVMGERINLDVPFGRAGVDHGGEVREVTLYAAPQPPAEREPLTPDALADRCEAWLQKLPIADAPNIVDAFEAGFRDGELAHGIGNQPITSQSGNPANTRASAITSENGSQPKQENSK